MSYDPNPARGKMALRSQLIRVVVMITVLVISGIVFLACRFCQGVLTTTDIHRLRTTEEHWPITLSPRTWRVADLLLLVATHSPIARTNV